MVITLPQRGSIARTCPCSSFYLLTDLCGRKSGTMHVPRIKGIRSGGRSKIVLFIATNLQQAEIEMAKDDSYIANIKDAIPQPHFG